MNRSKWLASAIFAALLGNAACDSSDPAPTDAGAENDGAGPSDEGTPDSGTADGADPAETGTDHGSHPEGGHGAACEPGSRTGDAAGSKGEKTAGGLNYLVRVPPGYNPEIGAPLIVVYAMCCVSGAYIESDTKLTADALARGYLIAYADHVKPSDDKKFKDAATIPGRIAEKWCVDPDRVYATGHSDGGSLSIQLPVFVGDTVHLDAIAPSAASPNASSFASVSCPAEPVSAMVMHSKNDGLFPVSSGIAQHKWFAMCGGCDATPGAPRADGCVAYPGCDEGVEVVYCEGTGPHAVWPKLNASILDFFDAAGMR